MRFMVIIKANAQSEAGEMPSEALITAMGDYNEEMTNAGVMLAAEGLLPSSKGAKVIFKGNNTSVVDGPFAETKELIAGFWILKVNSRDEALEWVKRMPNPDNEDFEVEVRQIGEMEDFGDMLTPELQEQEDRIREGLAAKNS